MQQNVPSGIAAVIVLEVVGAGAVDGDLVAVALAALGRDLDRAGAVEVGGGQAALGLEHVGQRALRDHLAAVDPGAGAEIDHVVGAADRILVVLDHDHRVAEVAQALERFDQPVVVALVEADLGFVEHVEHAREARTYLAREADSLRFPAA